MGTRFQLRLSAGFCFLPRPCFSRRLGLGLLFGAFLGLGSRLRFGISAHLRFHRDANPYLSLGSRLGVCCCTRFRFCFGPRFVLHALPPQPALCLGRAGAVSLSRARASVSSALCLRCGASGRLGARFGLLAFAADASAFSWRRLR
jgi:hypothetical protein